MSIEIVTIFEVTDFKTGMLYKEAMKGCGQEAISNLRAMPEYSKLSKYVLTGFEIDGRAKKRDLRTYNNIRI